MTESTSPATTSAVDTGKHDHSEHAATTTDTATEGAAAQPRLWSVGAANVVYGAVGAALYGVLGALQVPIPGAGGVTIRPFIAIVTFIGYRFGPWAGFFAGFVGNAIIDQIAGWGLVTYWWWHLANGLVGFIAGLLGWWLRKQETADEAKDGWKQVSKIAVVGLIAVVVAFWVTLIGLIFERSEFEVWFTTLYLPAIFTNIVATIILAPAIDRIWQPLVNRIGR